MRPGRKQESVRGVIITVSLYLHTQYTLNQTALANIDQVLFVDESSRLSDLYDPNRGGSPASTCELQRPKMKASSAVEDASHVEEYMPHVELDHHSLTPLQSNYDDANSELFEAAQFCTTSPLPQQLHPWRLENEYEIQLLRHYVDVIATWVHIVHSHQIITC